MKADATPGPRNENSRWIFYRGTGGSALGSLAIGLWAGFTMAFSGGGLAWGDPWAVFALTAAAYTCLGVAVGCLWGLVLEAAVRLPRAATWVRGIGPFSAGLATAWLLAARLAQGLPPEALGELHRGLKPALCLGVPGILFWAFRRRAAQGTLFAVFLGLAGTLALARWEPSPPPVASSPAPTPHLAVSRPFSAGATTRPKNLVILLIDTLRSDRLSCYGYSQPTSPRIDRLAAEGVRFEQAIVQSPSTSPSVATLFSGTYPHQHGVVRVWDRLPDRVVTLAEVLAGQGWQTAAVLANAVLYGPFNFEQGFQTRVELPSHSGGNIADRVGDAALEWLESHHRQPFFLYVHFLDPHTPYAPPDRFKGIFWNGPRSPNPRLLEIAGTHFGALRRDLMIEQSRDPDLYRARYEEEILYTDGVVGSILDRLDTLGHRDDTLVILTSDHGESLGEHEVFFVHGVVPFESNLKVPLILRYPPLLPPRVISRASAQTVDIFPTVADLMGFPVPGGLEGNSLAEVLTGSVDRGSDLTFTEVGGNIPRLMQVARTGKWKLVFNPAGIDPHRIFRYPLHLIKPESMRKAWWAAHQGPGFNHRWGLFDLLQDPGESRNLVAEGQPLPQGLKENLESWLGRGDPQRAPERLNENDLSPEVLETLKALGYAQ